MAWWTRPGKARIIEKLSLSGINSDTQAFLANELNSPVDVDGLVAAAVTDAQKVELYTASRLAIIGKRGPSGAISTSLPGA